mmetsp:Transcript_22436/g.30360  ORF Transcript_22436/g.30360 Transcript_22436/m.30360 type:complete len:236 (+) Transcript_22436:140-847(+)
MLSWLLPGLRLPVPLESTLGAAAEQESYRPQRAKGHPGCLHQEEGRVLGQLLLAADVDALRDRAPRVQREGAREAAGLLLLRHEPGARVQDDVHDESLPVGEVRQGQRLTAAQLRAVSVKDSEVRLARHRRPRGVRHPQRPQQRVVVVDLRHEQGHLVISRDQLARALHHAVEEFLCVDVPVPEVTVVKNNSQDTHQRDDKQKTPHPNVTSAVVLPRHDVEILRWLPVSNTTRLP